MHVLFVHYFEFYYHPHHSDMDFCPQFPAAASSTTC